MSFPPPEITPVSQPDRDDIDFDEGFDDFQGAEPTEQTGHTITSENEQGKLSQEGPAQRETGWPSDPKAEQEIVRSHQDPIIAPIHHNEENEVVIKDSNKEELREVQEERNPDGAQKVDVVDKNQEADDDDDANFFGDFEEAGVQKPEETKADIEEIHESNLGIGPAPEQEPIGESPNHEKTSSPHEALPNTSQQEPSPRLADEKVDEKIEEEVAEKEAPVIITDKEKGQADEPHDELGQEEEMNRNINEMKEEPKPEGTEQKLSESAHNSDNEPQHGAKFDEPKQNVEETEDVLPEREHQDRNEDENIVDKNIEIQIKSEIPVEDKKHDEDQQGENAEEIPNPELQILDEAKDVEASSEVVAPKIDDQATEEKREEEELEEARPPNEGAEIVVQNIEQKEDGGIQKDGDHDVSFDDFKEKDLEANQNITHNDQPDLNEKADLDDQQQQGEHEQIGNSVEESQKEDMKESNEKGGDPEGADEEFDDFEDYNSAPVEQQTKVDDHKPEQQEKPEAPEEIDKEPPESKESDKAGEEDEDVDFDDFEGFQEAAPEQQQVAAKVDPPARDPSEDQPKPHEQKDETRDETNNNSPPNMSSARGDDNVATFFSCPRKWVATEILETYSGAPQGFLFSDSRSGEEEETSPPVDKAKLKCMTLLRELENRRQSRQGNKLIPPLSQKLQDVLNKNVTGASTGGLNTTMITTNSRVDSSSQNEYVTYLKTLSTSWVNSKARTKCYEMLAIKEIKSEKHEEGHGRYSINSSTSQRNLHAQTSRDEGKKGRLSTGIDLTPKLTRNDSQGDGGHFMFAPSELKERPSVESPTRESGDQRNPPPDEAHKGPEPDNAWDFDVFAQKKTAAAHPQHSEKKDEFGFDDELPQHESKQPQPKTSSEKAKDFISQLPNIDFVLSKVIEFPADFFSM